MDRCVACGAELGVGRFCLNCGHPVGAPAPTPPPTEPSAVAPPAAAPTAQPEPEPQPDPEPVESEPEPESRESEPVETEPVEPEPEPAATQAVPVQAADPTAVPPPGTVPVSEPVAEPVAEPVEKTEKTEKASSGTRKPLLKPLPNLLRKPVRTTPGTSVARERPPRRRTPWDPDAELLPYEEVDDLDRDDPGLGRAWIVWVVGAALLVGLVVVLLQAFAADDEVATDPGASDSSTGRSSGTSSGTPSSDPGSEETSPASTEAPAATGPRIQLATGATFVVPDTAPPTQDFDGTLVAYEASQMGDGNPSTTWRTAGDATGQTITVALTEPAVVQRVGLVNGYTKQVAGVDWYPNNRRILAVTWTFDDGTTASQTFTERPGLQVLKVSPVETSTVTITIDSVTPPGSGNLGRDYTAISEVSVIGRSAG